jgi:two-component system sensor histidine kinase PhoQ
MQAADVRRRGSISRRLMLAVAAPLVLAFLLTAFFIDYLVSSLADEAQADRIEQQMLSLVALTRLDHSGRVDAARLANLARAADVGTGRYLLVLGTVGQVLWHSPSVDERKTMGGDPVPAGQRNFEYCHLPGVGPAALLSLGLRLDGEAERYYDLTLVAGEDRAGLLARRSLLRKEMLVWFGGVTLLLVLLVSWIMRRELAPVRRLEREVSEIDAGGREQLTVDYPPELNGLAQSLNALLNSERQRIGRYRDTLGNLAHSIKTPLAVMRTSLEGESARVRAVLDREVQRIAQLVDHQLRRAATSGSRAVGQRSVPLAPLVADLRATLLRVHAAKDITFQVDVQAGASFVGDAGDVTEMLGNVLDNACKWSRFRLSIQVRVDAAAPMERSLQIAVCDDGPGIAPEDRQRVLGRGVRADEQAPGHGLGLAMVAEAVALYGGGLVIGESRELGGARVDIYLPGRLTAASA